MAVCDIAVADAAGSGAVAAVGAGVTGVGATIAGDVVATCGEATGAILTGSAAGAGAAVATGGSGSVTAGDTSGAAALPEDWAGGWPRVWPEVWAAGAVLTEVGNGDRAAGTAVGCNEKPEAALTVLAAVDAACCVTDGDAPCADLAAGCVLTGAGKESCAGDANGVVWGAIAAAALLSVFTVPEVGLAAPAPGAWSCLAKRWSETSRGAA